VRKRQWVVTILVLAEAVRNIRTVTGKMRDK
jgi:hypothetical protein